MKFFSDPLKDDKCTGVPDKWFGVSIGDICDKHDADYRKGGAWQNKILADFKFGGRIFLRGLRHSFLVIVGPIYFLGVLVLGWSAWYGR